jgi:uncharacterized protein (DUF2164 family)
MVSPIMEVTMSYVELSAENKKTALAEIKQFFEQERDEILGDLASGIILDFILEKIGPVIYNQAVADVQKYMSEKVEDLYALMK